MKKEFLIKALNMGLTEVLTLEKAEDRVEFQALAILPAENSMPCEDYCRSYDPGCDADTLF